MFLHEYFTIILPTYCIFEPWLYVIGPTADDVAYTLKNPWTANPIKSPRIKQSNAF